MNLISSSPREEPHPPPADSLRGPNASADSTPIQVATPPEPDPLPAILAQPYTVLFAFAGPHNEGRAATDTYLDELVTYLKQHPSKKALLRGYTDDTAARENNLKLAQRRCKAIAEMLHARGLGDTQILSEPLGEADPVATNDTPEGRRLNRRVVISIQE